MPERRIIDLPGHRHFVTFSTHQRRRFLDSAETRDIVLEVLQKCLISHQGRCAGFVIMPNHLHALLFGEADFDISVFIQAWKKTSSYRIKRFLARELSRYAQLCPEDSPIWRARFYDFKVESDEKFREKLCYMHNNPVIAGLVESALDWKWSSARYYELGEPVGVNLTP
jgi:putative transposase